MEPGTASSCIDVAQSLCERCRCDAYRWAEWASSWLELGTDGDTNSSGTLRLRGDRMAGTTGAMRVAVPSSSQQANKQARECVATPAHGATAAAAATVRWTLADAQRLSERTRQPVPP